MKRFALFGLMVVLWTTSSATTFVVSNNNDSGTGSLREAITNANADASATVGSPHIINATAVTDTIKLTTILPAIARHVTINGSTSGNLKVSRLNSTSGFKIFTINASITVVMNYVTVHNGKETAWGQYAGGINNGGTLTLNNCKVLNCTNTGGSQAGGIYNAGTLSMESCLVNNCTVPMAGWNNGGGLYSIGAGTVTINNCTFSNNYAIIGAGIYFMGNAARTITNSTINNNQSDGAGAGIYNTGSGLLTIKSTTVSSNQNNYNLGAGISSGGSVALFNSTIVKNTGGGIGASGTFQLSNCIVMSNYYSGSITDVSGSTSSLYGHNIFSSNVTTSGSNANIVNAVDGEVFNSTLANNGGPTYTHSLVSCSKAINNGTTAGSPLTDQRGITRSDSVDIGAFESASGASGTPYVVKQPTSVSVCGDVATSFTMSMSATLGVTYQWQVNDGAGFFLNINNGGVYSGATAATLNISSSAGLNNYQYRCLVASEACGYVQTSSTATLTYAQNPVIAIQPTDFAVCVSGYKSIGYSASGTALTYQWQVDKGTGFVNVVNDANHTGATAQYLNVGPATTGMNGWIYKVIIKNSCNVQVTSNPVTAVVQTSGPSVSLQPSNITTCVGTPASFTVAGTGTLLTYQWQMATSGSNWVTLNNGANYSNVTSPTLNISGITTSLNGYSYRCTISNACQGNVSNAAVLNVVNGATISSHPASQTVCTGQSVNYSVVASGISLAYQWQINRGSGFVDLTNSGPYSNVTASTMNISGAPDSINNFQFRCKVLSASCTGIYTNAAGLVVKSVVSINSQPDSIIVCSGSGASFSVAASGTGITYQWQVNNGSGFTSISNGGIYSNVTTSTLSISSVSSGMNNYTYRCVLNNTCTSNYTTEIALLSVNPSLSVSLQPVSKAICVGENTSFSIAANGLELDYHWQVNAGTGFTTITDTVSYAGFASPILQILNADAEMNSNYYRCIITSSCGTVTSSNTLLTINAHPSIFSQPVNQSICIGATANFIVGSSNTGDYQWQVNKGTGFTNVVDDGYHSNSSTANMSVHGDVNVNGWIYRAVLNNGCISPVLSDSVDMEVMYSPEFSTQPSPKTVCDGSSTTFSVSATGDYVQYQWFTISPMGAVDTVRNNDIFSGATTPVLLIDSVTSSLDGYSYRCVISNPWASYSSFWAQLNVGADSVITVQPTNQQACPGSNVNYTVVSSDSAATFQWQINHGGGFVDLFDGGLYSNVTTNQLTITGIPSAFVSKQFRCKVISSSCSVPVYSDAVGYQVPTDYPVITLQPEFQPGCEEPVLYGYMQSAGTGLNYAWQVDDGNGYVTVEYGGPYFNVNTHSLGVYPQTSMNGYLYRAIVSANTSCGAVQIYSEPTMLDINAVVKIKEQPANQYSCESGNTSFKISTSGYNITYQWQVHNGLGYVNVTNDGNYSGATDSILFVSNVTSEMNNFKYRVHINTPMCPGGFYSNAGTLVINSSINITAQPVDKMVCTGNVIGVRVETLESGLNYQWQVFNGTTFVDLADGGYYGQVATNNLAVVGHASIDGLEYRCRISNNCLVVYTDTVVVNVNGGPSVIIQPTDKSSLNNSDVTFAFTASGISLSYQWQAKAPGAPGFSSVANGTIYSGVTTNSLTVTKPAFSMTGTQFRCIITSGGCGSILTNTIALTVNEFGICMLTVDETTGKNKVVYEVPSDIQGIDSFVIYREGTVSNQYNLLSKIGKSDESLFIDTASNPAKKAYVYKIAVQDSLGNIYGLSSAHKTVHLMINKGLNDTWNLLWTAYIGKEVYSYKIYRGTTTSGLNLIETLSGSEISYTDFSAPVDASLYYQIEVVTDPCDVSSPSLLKSNFAIANGSSKSTGLISAEIYPNPAYELVFVNGIGENFNYKLYDLRGYLLIESVSNGNQINVNSLKSGMYILETESANGKSSSALIKQ